MCKYHELLVGELYHYQSSIPVAVSKTILILGPIPIKIDRAIESSLYYCPRTVAVELVYDPLR